jgi:hypothetical protein
MTDAYPWPVGVRLMHLNPDEVAGAAATEDSAASEGNSSAKAWHKRSSLFRAYSAYNSSKRISFAVDKELRAVLFYEATPSEVRIAEEFGTLPSCVEGSVDFIALLLSLLPRSSRAPFLFQLAHHAP